MTTQTTPDLELSDSELFDRAADSISIPRVEKGDSFVLHAPLELLARSSLLEHVSPSRRDAVRERMNEIASTYAAWGHAVERAPERSDALQAAPERVLRDALSTGDSEAADDAISLLAEQRDTPELVRTLADLVLPSLSAAAHGSILLYLLPRAASRSLTAATMARTTIHELVRNPTSRLSWFGDTPESVGGESVGRTSDQAESELVERLRAPKLTEGPGNTFIEPIMSAAERSGLAGEALSDLVPDLDVAAARRALLRSAALSMLQDNPEHAPYGWSHTLTMPQAALGVAHASTDPRTAISVAATYVLGFRAALGSATLDPSFRPEPVVLAPAEMVVALPDQAASAAWHVPAADRPDVWRELAGHAGGHHDAHLAKYTLACLDAARADRSHEHLYLAAAAYLNAWWNNR